MSTNDSTAAEIIEALKELGITYKEIARSVGRSPRYLTKVRTGEDGTTGEHLLPQLRELINTGTVRSGPAPYRRRKDGKMAKIRRKKKDGDDSENPTSSAPEPWDENASPDNTTKPIGPARPGRLGISVTYTGQGGRMLNVTFPKTNRFGSRQRGIKASRHELGRLRSSFRHRGSDPLAKVTCRTNEGLQKTLFSHGWRLSLMIAEIDGLYGGDLLAAANHWCETTSGPTFNTNTGEKISSDHDLRLGEKGVVIVHAVIELV